MVVWATETCMNAAMGTSAVAIMELLMGFSVDPIYSGATNFQENGLPLGMMDALLSLLLPHDLRPDC
ncbi:hypothetical protein GCM10025857_23330 [Alicyclobacillus contaminans]|nr:hypothetical protein GCM10025857_23330 [Alicyclobacillus contaminans]